MWRLEHAQFAVAARGPCGSVACCALTSPFISCPLVLREKVVIVAATASTAAGCGAVLAMIWFFCPKSCIASKFAKKARSMSVKKREGEDGPGKTNAADKVDGFGFGDGYLEVGGQK